MKIHIGFRKRFFGASGVSHGSLTKCFAGAYLLLQREQAGRVQRARGSQVARGCHRRHLCSQPQDQAHPTPPRPPTISEEYCPAKSFTMILRPTNNILPSATVPKLIGYFCNIRAEPKRVWGGGGGSGLAGILLFRDYKTVLASMGKAGEGLEDA
jgi:hypothetical protein